MTNKICPLPWNHLSIQQNGDFRLCCQCVHPPFGRTDKRIQIHTLEDARNSEVHKRVRKQMINGKEPSECKLCWDEEKLGLTSKRLHMLQHYNIDNFVDNTVTDGSIDKETFPLKYLDIRFGNLCNLKCRSCNPSDSSLWYEDFVALSNQENPSFNFYSGPMYQLQKINNTWVLKNDDFHWYDLDAFWEQLQDIIPHIDRLYLTGGEPWINKAQWKLLTMCIESGYSKNILLEYNSNMTKIPAHACETWEQFKEVHIGCSIDAVGKATNYIRYPSIWEELEENIRYLGSVNNTVVKLAPTISVFNVLEFLDLAKWLTDNRIGRLRPVPSFHILHGPQFQCITVLPKETKEFITNEYNNWFNNSKWGDYYRKEFSPILEFMNGADDSRLLPELKRHTDILDRSRNQNIRDFIPWLADVLDTVKTD